MTDLGYFPPEQVERARRYHRPLYRLLLLDTTLGLATLAALAFAVPLGWTSALPWPAATAALAALATAAIRVVRLPSGAWRHARDRTWELTDQAWRDWSADRAKALAISVVFALLATLPLVGLARTLPSAWPFAAGAAAALLVLVLGFLAPVVLEPVFSRFEPLADERLARELREMSVRAGVPVREVLVADASRRTRRHNAYVSGLGRTRRVVVWDTLLAAADPRQVALVVAHELGHRRHRHVAALTLAGMAGAGLSVAVLWALPLDVADPRSVPALLLAVTALELLGLPFGSWLSRRFERTADRFSLELTGDVDAYERAFRELSVANVADLAPPRLAYLLLFSHPTPPERLAAGRAWSRQHGAA